MATYSNIFIDQGSDFGMTVDLEQSTGTLDLTGYTARGHIKKSYDSTSLRKVDGTLFTNGRVNFTVGVDSTNKELDVSLLASTTSEIKAGRYVYDIEIVSGDSPAKVTRVLEGQLEVTPRVTG